MLLPDTYKKSIFVSVKINVKCILPLHSKLQKKSDENRTI